MGICVEKLPHSCGTRTGLQVFEKEGGGYDGFCFSCSTYVEDPYLDKPEGYKPEVFRKSAEDIEKEIEEIHSYGTHALPTRKLKKWALEHFNVKCALSEQDGETVDAYYFPYTKEGRFSGYRGRLTSKKVMWSVGPMKEVDLFGWEQAISAGGKKIFITEGEADAVALYQIFKERNAGTKYSDLDPPVVSIPFGVSSATKDILRHIKKIRESFKEIVLVFDTDAAGRKAAEEVMKVVPEAKLAPLPAKDVNECIEKGRAKAAYDSIVFQASRPKNTRLVNAVSLFEEAKKAPEEGYPWPWKGLTKTTRGIRKGETIYIGAAQKMGKSEVVNALAAHFIRELGWKVMLAKPEESNVKSVKLVAGKIAGKFFHDPNVPFDEEAYEKATDVISDKLYLINLYQHLGWESLQADIREAASEGCEAVFIDPITNLVNGLDAATQNTKLQEIAQELSAMALDLNIVIFIFCHLRNPDSGVAHERGGEVLSSQFAGSRAMARSCNLMLGIEGNKDPSLSAEERNMRDIVLLEDREFGETGRFKLYWDNKTGLFNEINV